MGEALRLRWVKEDGMPDACSAYSGELCVGFVLKRSSDGVIVWTATQAVHMRHIAKTNGEVSSFDSGKRAVERAWRTWLDKAALTPVLASVVEQASS